MTDRRGSTLVTTPKRTPPCQGHEERDQRDHDGEDDRERVPHRVRICIARWLLHEVTPSKPEHDCDPDESVANEVVELSVSMSLHWPSVRSARADPLLEFPG